MTQDSRCATDETTKMEFATDNWICLKDEHDGARFEVMTNGAIKIEVGGSVHVRTAREWHAAAVQALRSAVAKPSSLPIRPSDLQRQIDIMKGYFAGNNIYPDDFDLTDILAVLEWAAGQSVSAIRDVPEGCTPTDARVLREANAILAEENHNLRRCLRFYANGEHYIGLKHWEGPSGDDNWLCPPLEDFGDYRQQFIDAMDEAMVEDGSVARATLISGKFDCEPDEEPRLIEGEPEWKIAQEAVTSDSRNP